MSIDSDQPSHKKRLSKEEALAKMQRYCVFQDRCHQEVRRKLIEHQVYGDDLEDIISSLIDDNFLNEERFAIAFANGKCKIKRWGRIRITQALKQRQISDYCIKKAMAQIDLEIYQANLVKELLKKWHPADTSFTKQQKAIQYVLRKGYTYEEAKKAQADLAAEHN